MEEQFEPTKRTFPSRSCHSTIQPTTCPGLLRYKQLHKQFEPRPTWDFEHFFLFICRINCPSWLSLILSTNPIAASSIYLKQYLVKKKKKICYFSLEDLVWLFMYWFCSRCLFFTRISFFLMRLCGASPCIFFFKGLHVVNILFII